MKRRECQSLQMKWSNSQSFSSETSSWEKQIERFLEAGKRLKVKGFLSPNRLELPRETVASVLGLSAANSTQHVKNFKVPITTPFKINPFDVANSSERAEKAIG